MAEPGAGGRRPGPVSGRGKEPPPRPRWVMAFGIAVIALVLAFLLLHLTGMVPNHPAMHR